MGLNLADFFLVAAAILSAVSLAAGRVTLQLRWQFLLLPALVLMLMARDAIVFDRLPFQQLTAALYTTGESVGETAGGSAAFLGRILLCWTIIGVATSAFRDRKDALVRLAGFWSVGIGISAVWTVVQYAAGLPDLPFLYHVDSAVRSVGLSNHPNSLAETVCVAIPLFCHYAFGREKKVQLRMLAFIGLTAGVWSLFLSGSRAGLAMGLIAFVGSGVVRLRLSGRGIWGIPLGLLATAVGILVLPQVWATTRFSAGSAQLSNTARAQALQEGFEIFVSHPILGAGLSSWLGEMVPLILLAGGGLLLFAVFYAGIGSVFVRGLRGSRDELTAQLSWSACIVLMFGILNNGIVERYLYWPFILAFFLTLNRANNSSTSEAQQ
ncbi:O-antigen ligase [Curtobacterium sp. AG1037]|uniref:O-antigen ligase family protein n=1 Tax=Curtobacterium sp. AG1037 TaxID=2183990 RepID=UPI0011C048BE|nr:hypothetical protein [Curtobacterium sp. AG1037]